MCGECIKSALSSVHVVFVGLIWPVEESGVRGEPRVLVCFKVTLFPSLDVTNVFVTVLWNRTIKTQR